MTHDRMFRHELPGGAVLVGETVPDRHSVALGIWIRAGSRHESPGLEGAAHFIEHLVFKGTDRRTAREIAESVERVGGALDAYTTKETTCFHVRVLEDDLELAVDVLSDLVMNPAFREEDVARERKVVLEELRNVGDNPEDLVGDLVMERLWPDHVMGASILGTEASLAALTPGRVREFHGDWYRGPRTVISATGAVDPDRLRDMFARRLALPSGNGRIVAPAPQEPPPALSLYPRDVSQLYLTLYRAAPAERHPRRPAAQILAEIFGGGMSSRLFQTIREEAGLAYSVYCYTEHFEDTGLFATSLAVSPRRGREALERTRGEMDRLVREGLAPGELEAARAQVRGSLVMGLESLTNRMSHLARNEIQYGRLEPYEAELAEFEGVDEEEVVESARTLLDPGRQGLVALGPGDLSGLDDGRFAAVTTREEPA